MPIVEQVASDLIAAMKAQDALKTSTLRMAKSSLKNREIEKKAPPDDDEACKVLRSLVKQREDSAQQFRQAGRPELADKEEAEIGILKGYLPAEASDAEIEAAVEQAAGETGAASPKDLGRLMKAALAALASAGKTADGRRVNEAVRKRLG